MAPSCLKAERYNQGLGVYGIMHKRFPCEAITDAFKGMGVLRLSILWHTFGDSTRCLNQWALDPRPKFLQVHTINEVCQRNRRCGRYELLRGISPSRYRRMLARDKWLLKPLDSYLAPLTQWLNTNPQVNCNISMGLESNLDRTSYINLINMAKPLLPSTCSYTWNPANNNPYGVRRIPGLIHELHGSKWSLRPPCIANLDGEDIDLKTRPAILRTNFLPYDQIGKYLRTHDQCLANFIWIPELNGNSSRAFIDPRLRSFVGTRNAGDILGPILRR
jgi:hypothetical protein